MQYQSDNLQPDEDMDADEVARLQAEFAKVMVDDTKAATEVHKFSLDNPITGRYKRKKAIDWASFKRTYGKRRANIADDICKPMTQAEFIIWATDKKGLTKPEATEWWLEHKRDPKIDRDNLGFRGRQQLHIPKGAKFTRRTETYIDNAAEEGCTPVKKPKAADREAFRQLVKAQENTFEDNFFESSPGSMRQVPVDAGDSGSASAAKKSTANVELDREVPKFYSTMETKIAAAKAECHKAITAGQQCWVMLRACKQESVNPALEKFALTLSYKMQMLYRWRNEPSETYILKMLGEHKHEAHDVHMDLTDVDAAAAVGEQQELLAQESANAQVVYES